MEKTVMEYLHIRPSTTRIRSIDPDNVASLNAKSYFVANTGTFKLVRVPPLVKRSWFQDFKVRAIDGNQTVLIVVVVQAILPLDLQIESYE